MIRGGAFAGAGPGAPRSPDRADAMVWALSGLLLGRRFEGLGDAERPTAEAAVE